MTREEILTRRLSGQFLTAPSDLRAVARGLCGLQAQFLSNALHALRIRSTDFSEQAAHDALVKSWTLRGTIHVFDPDDLALYLDDAHCRSNIWDTPSFWNQRADWALSPARQAELTTVITDALSAAPQTREALKAICRAHGMTEDEERSMFHPWGGGLREACERGFACYAVCSKKTLIPCRAFTPMPRDEAALALARRYFTHYGPATVHDAMYFFHAPMREVKGWLDRLPLESVEYDGRTYYWIDSPSQTADAPVCIFLAGFDPMLLGYEKKESLILAPEHLRQVFSLAGIVSPTVLLHGQIRATWKRKGRSVVLAPLDVISACDRQTIIHAAEALWPDAAVQFV